MSDPSALERAIVEYLTKAGFQGRLGEPRAWPWDIDADVVFLGRALQQIAVKREGACTAPDLIADLLGVLQSGALASVTRDHDGSRLRVPPRAWDGQEGLKRLTTLRISDEDMFRVGMPANSTVAISPNRILDLYVYRDALEHYLNLGSPKPGLAKPVEARAKRALKELFSDGIPDQTDVSDAELNKRVADYMTANGQRPASKTTILRAAGRRK